MIAQKHRKKWTEEEILFLKKSFKNAVSLEEIQETISLRTTQAILTKANALGYGYYHNNNDGYTYFKKEIKYKKGDVNIR